MDNPQKKSGAQQAAAGTKSKAAEEGGVGKRFEQAYQDYLTALKETQAESQKRWLQAQRDYASAIQNSWVDTQKRLNDLNQGYVTQVQDAWGDENAEKLVTEAYRTYTQTLRSAYDDAQKQYQDTNETHAKPVQDLGEETKKNCQRAYQNYVSAIKDAWAAADAGAIDVNTFAAISNSIAAAACVALNTTAPSSTE